MSFLTSEPQKSRRGDCFRRYGTTSKSEIRVKKRYPNAIEVEAALAFKHFFTPEPLPQAGSPKDDVQVDRRRFLRIARRAVRRGFRRSHADLSKIKIAIPRVLNMYSTGPFFRTYFETLGLDKRNIIWSIPTNEDMWVEGGRYGSIDPCFPSKVIQAHIHELLFHAHTDEKKRRGPIDYLYYPCITAVPSWVTHTMDNATCPIVAGSPNVIKAAFTKEVDFFERAGIEYIDKALSFCEPNLMKQVLFGLWGPRLGVTEDESDWAVDQGFAAIAAFNQRMELLGREILEEVVRDNRMALLVIGRPYHNDPGINHGIPDEFQVLGYPILSMRSIPKDREWLAQWFGDDDPLDIRDVWPENFSANSVQKVWAARFAARHPNIAILDLSSFKCGHDAPTYGIIENIVEASKTPFSALHDIDANKPTGSIGIRVKTYAYKLALVEEELADRAQRRVELAKRIAQKRRELIARRTDARESIPAT